jgi:hypothetical protein
LINGGLRYPCCFSHIIVESEHVDDIFIREAAVQRDEEVVRTETRETKAMVVGRRHATSSDGADILSKESLACSRLPV